ncbi:hypothetical protein [Calorimonas adulescens]|uniref:hypothetical protein n=1 Tax=Calorimonas adulescens TaxID=2606906 RepID=UPI0013969535|nr:hypothetical protein [Calorimonas adulescens]
MKRIAKGLLLGMVVGAIAAKKVMPLICKREKKRLMRRGKRLYHRIVDIMD